jgi:ribosome maturation factor RimP
LIDKQGLIDLLDPVVAALGYDLVDLDVRAGRNGLLRLYIDRPAGKEGVTLGDCELVSGQISAFLDVEDPLPGSYVLEVSSPGLDRRLRTTADFERFAGSEVKVELKRAAEEGRRRFRGTLKGVDADEVIVDVDGAELRWDLDDIAEARLVPRTKLGSG